MLALILAPVFAANVELLNDGFEGATWNAHWNDNGGTSWTRGIYNPHGGSYVARAANGSEGNFTSDNLDSSDALSIVVDFYYRHIATEQNDLILYYYNGSSYVQIATLGVTGAHDTWQRYTQTITDPQYLKSNFHIRFNATLGPNEYAYIDDVLITKDTGETLTVSKSGNGSGTVTSDPTGIDCGSDCSEDFDYNTVVTLTATADTGSSFSGWTGACTGFGDCVVTMDEAKSVDAQFTLGLYVLSISKFGTGSGTVSSVPPGIDCGLDCTEDFDYNTVVTLTATTDWLSTFKGWGGACTGTDDCVVTMNEAKSVTAEFMTYFIYLPLLFK